MIAQADLIDDSNLLDICGDDDRDEIVDLEEEDGEESDLE